MQIRMIKPSTLLTELPLPLSSQHAISLAKKTISHILWGLDKRLLVIVGPCSIHDTTAGLEYAHLLHRAARHYNDDLFIVMRAYLEKPRTTLGWKGLISDPFLNGKPHINEGLRLARSLLLDLSKLGMPAASEFLDTITPQYLSDLISWCAIGARTSESQLHRELASGLPMPVGFKNTTDGNIKTAIDAVCTAQKPHHFLSIDPEGYPTVFLTEGNPHTHIILRGSRSESNYSASHITLAGKLLRDAEVQTKLIIDCSHGNSGKNYLNQIQVVDQVATQLMHSCQLIAGVMIESNLVGGKQSLQPTKLTYGQSITDECISWQETIPLLEKLALAMRKRNAA